MKQFETLALQIDAAVAVESMTQADRHPGRNSPGQA
jgi:hypothetical protein